MNLSEFARRLSELRLKKGVSARDMSLSLGQSPGYINNLENKINYPSMAMFFVICEYLEITPLDFFDTEKKNPHQLQVLFDACRNIDDESLEALTILACKLENKN